MPQILILTRRDGSESIDALRQIISSAELGCEVLNPDELARRGLPTAQLGLVDVMGVSQSEFRALCARVDATGGLPIAVVPSDGRRLTQTIRKSVWEDGWAAIDLGQSREAILAIIKVGLRQVGFSRGADGDTQESDGSGVVAESPAMREVFRHVDRMASAGAPVMVLGETGTGKELVARSLHDRSTRRKGPFVAVNCGAIPAQLAASELFGYEKGAFTGANTSKPGRIEQANGGTLFLDEIGDLPAQAQTYLLRVIQEGVLERLGGRHEIPVDVRIVAATHVDLQAAVTRGDFRLDLLHRLQVLELRLPPLRERGTDVMLLAEHFFQRYRVEARRRIRGFSDDARRSILNHDWPGNIRELSNRIRQACVMSDGRWIEAEDLQINDRQAVQVLTLEQARERAEVEAVSIALRESDGNMSRAADRLGVSRMTLYRLVQRLNIDGGHVQEVRASARLAVSGVA